MPPQSVRQIANPVVTLTANPTINVNLGTPSPSQPSGAKVEPPKVRPNMKFVEAKSIAIHEGNGSLYESPQGLGDFRVAVACFRNEAIVGQTLKQPSSRAHIIFRDSTGKEVADVSSGVWLQTYKDAVTFTVGTKHCLILFLLTNQGSLKRLWKESYTTEHSWMGGPHFRVGDDVISGRVASVEVALLEVTTGTCLLQSIFDVGDYVDGELPGLVLNTVSPI